MRLTAAQLYSYVWDYPLDAMGGLSGNYDPRRRAALGNLVSMGVPGMRRAKYGDVMVVFDPRVLADWVVEARCTWVAAQ